jgi:hypothetical protein
VPNGPNASCTGDDTLDANCLTFSGAVTSPMTVGTGILGLDAVAYGNRVAVAYVNSGGLKVVQFEDITQGAYLTPVLQWTAVETVQALGVASKAPELAVLAAASGWNGTLVQSSTGMPALPPPGSGSFTSFLSLTWVTSTGVLQTSTKTPTAWTLPKPLKKPDQTNIVAAEAPALVQIPGQLIGDRCGVFQDFDKVGGRVLAYRCQQADGTWAEQGAFFDSPAATTAKNPFTLSGKAAVAYHAFRRSDGTLLSGSLPGELQIVQWFQDGDYMYPKVWYSRAIDKDTIDAARFDRSGPYGNVWTVLPPGNPIALHGSKRMTGLKAFGVVTDIDQVVRLMFFPEADGIFDETYSDGNDWAAMESCIQLKGAAACHMP